MSLSRALSLAALARSLPIEKMVRMMMMMMMQSDGAFVRRPSIPTPHFI